MIGEESKEMFSYVYENKFGLDEIQILNRSRYEENPYYKLLSKIENYKKGNNSR